MTPSASPQARTAEVGLCQSVAAVTGTGALVVDEDPAVEGVVDEEDEGVDGSLDVGVDGVEEDGVVDDVDCC